MTACIPPDLHMITWSKAELFLLVLVGQTEEVRPTAHPLTTDCVRIVSALVVVVEAAARISVTTLVLIPITDIHQGRPCHMLHIHD